MDPLISVIIPLYNKEEQIGSTIESVLNQTFSDYEIVVVNDGSTDNGLKTVESYHDPRIRIVSQKNSGVSVARNRGIHEAKGAYIAFLDADDQWKKEYLQSQIDAIRSFPDCSVFATAYEYKDENGVITPAIFRGVNFNGSAGIMDNYFKVASVSAPPIWTSAVMVKKDCFGKVGGFMPGVATGEDLLLWAELASEYKIAFTKTSLVQYNLPSGGTLRIDPKDMSKRNDIVREELIRLKKEKNPLGLRLYLSFWDKMRAVINIRKGEQIETLKYAWSSIRWNPGNVKAYVLLLLGLLPSKISKYILR